jgi:2-polyprenyl-3-methyl-5-hydroxy-6-metoxy-1,4-benzoquinol methylase
VTHSSEKHWQKWGKENPYYGVVSHEEYRGESLENVIEERFYQTGHDHIDLQLEKLKKLNISIDNIGDVIDFGCGVGRLTLPLAKKFKRVIGLDVSDDMLNIASEKAKNKNICNVDFINSKNLDTIKMVDMINSYIVFQHIPKKMGMKIVDNLIKKLRKDGIGILHFTIKTKTKKISKFLLKVRSNVGIINIIINIIKKRPASDAPMLMEEYSLEELINIFRKHCIKEFFIEIVDHAGNIGVDIIFKK